MKKMRFIAIGFWSKAHRPLLIRLMQKYRVDYCELVHHKIIGKMDAPNNVKIKYHDTSDLRFKGEYRINPSEIIPLELPLLKLMEPYRSIAYDMMDRFVYFKEEYNPEFNKADFRRDLFIKHLTYWNSTIINNSIDFVIFDAIPHKVFDWILYGLCLVKKIPIFMFTHYQIHGTIIYYNSLEDPNPEIRNTYEKLLLEYEDKDIDEIQLNEIFDQYWISHVSHNSDITPFFIKKFLRKRKFLETLRFHKRLMRSMISGKITFKRQFNYFLDKLKTSRLSKYYSKLAQTPDFQKKYIYLPLHYQPESTTCPIGSIFNDQRLIIALLSYCVPDDTLIYVKEHPTQNFFTRSKEYYEYIYKRKNVVIVPKRTNTFDLIDNCIAVATVSGTAGWEALFTGKPTLLFGAVFYKYADGVFPIKTIDDCRLALDKICINKKKPDLKRLKIFMKAVQENSIKAFTIFNYQKITNISNEENNDAIFNSLSQKIDRKFQELMR